jgi:hypothetical protein
MWLCLVDSRRSFVTQDKTTYIDKGELQARANPPFAIAALSKLGGLLFQSTVVK